MFESIYDRIKIDPEFKSLIDPLTSEEFKQLEQNLINDGCIDAVRVWHKVEQDEIILLDGHNRLEICKKHALEFAAESFEFNDRQEAIDWMIQHQLGRRNLSPDQVSYLRGLQYRREKQKRGAPEGNNNAEKQSGKSCHFVSEEIDSQPELAKTESILAAQHNVSPRTIRYDAKYSEAVDQVTAVAGLEATRTLQTLPRQDQIRLGQVAEQAPETVRNAVAMLENSLSKSDAKTVVNEAVKEAKIAAVTTPIPEDDGNQDETLETEFGKVHVLHRPETKASLNRTNESVDWAWWTWNPVTGCNHGCEYCYARQIANNERMAKAYPHGFEPVYHPYRLDAPFLKKPPSSEDPRSKRIFTCSMADLFGKWVPEDWIMSVFDVVTRNPQWDFLFLTKFPQRLQEINDKLGGFSDNVWVGASVDTQARVALTEKAFKGIKAKVKWLSCEPLLGSVKFSSLDMFDLVAIGAQSPANGLPAFQPEWTWVFNLLEQAEASNCKIYWKENLKTPKQIPST